MKIVTYTTIDQKIMKDWEALWESSQFSNYTNAPQWFTSTIETFDYKEYVIIGFYKKEKLQGVAALVKEKRYGITLYTVAPTDFICGVPFLADVENKEIMKALGNALRNLGTVYLENVPEELITALRNTISVTATPTSVNFYVEVQKNDKGEVTIPHRRRLLRRSESIEDDITLYGPDADVLETAFSIDKKSNKQEYGYNAFADEKTISFYRTLQKHFGNRFSVFLLKHKNKPAAYQIGFQINQTFYCSQIAFLKKYEVYSIGRSLLIRLIEYLGANGIQIVDFGSGEDHVKRSLTKNQRILYSVVIAKKSVTGKYITFIDETRNYLYSQLHKNKSIYALYRKIKSRNK